MDLPTKFYALTARIWITNNKNPSIIYILPIPR